MIMFRQYILSWMVSPSHICQFQCFSKIFVLYFLGWVFFLLWYLLFLLTVDRDHDLLAFLLRKLQILICLSLHFLFDSLYFLFFLNLFYLFLTFYYFSLRLNLHHNLLWLSFNFPRLTSTLFLRLQYQLLYFNLHISHSLLLLFNFLL